MKLKPIALLLALAAPLVAGAQGMKVVSDTKAEGFVWPESVGCDTRHKVLYVGNFGSEKLETALKDGLGYISKVSPDGKILEKRFLPAPGGAPMNKPKGIWVRGNRLWVTDIDAVWIFDTKTKKGRKLDLPGVEFANDPAVVGKALYVSDNRTDQLVKVEPADFLDAKVQPKITGVFKGAGVNPNGLWPARKGGGLYMAGFAGADKPRAIFLLKDGGKPSALTDALGRLDGLYQMKDGSILATNWDGGLLFRWTKKGGVEKVADGFKGPADFCVFSETKKKATVIVPDLAASHIRIIKLEK